MKGKKYSFKCAFERVCGMMRSLKSNINVIILTIEVRLFYRDVMFDQSQFFERTCM